MTILSMKTIKGGVSFVLSLWYQTRNTSFMTYCLLACILNKRYPVTPVYCWSDHFAIPNSLPLDHTAIFFEYVIINSKWFFASQTVRWNKLSLILYMWLFQGPFSKMCMVKYSRYYRFIRSFIIQGIHCSLFRCDGSSHGRKWEGMWDNLWVPHIWLIDSSRCLLLSDLPTLVLMFTYETLKNTKTKTLVSLCSST